MKDLTLIIENVRTFRGRHEIPIRPLTILTGENSSGKTTLLAMFAALCDQEAYPLRPDFNSAPYNLGSYDTIASHEPGLGDGASYFSLGFRKEEPDSVGISEACARYVTEQGLVRIDKFKARRSEFQFSLAVKEAATDGLKGTATIRIEKKIKSVRFSDLETYAPGMSLARLAWTAAKPRSEEMLPSDPDILELSSHLLHLTPARATSLGPVRTRPERVYSRATETYKPTGEHIPFFLEQLLEEGPGGPRREAFLRMLRIFGNKSGLFEELAVNRVGTKANAPFELQIEIGGISVSLADVGYGVSQVLPLLVEASKVSRDQYLLIQQPEIHLHPRAQAELGTLFVELSADNHSRYIVETHSDYLVDRVRQEVAAGKIVPEMVALLYLHREGLKTKCHLIEMDRLGNLINPPDDYRSFFLEEEWRLLRRGARN